MIEVAEVVDINLIAVLVAAVAMFVIGAVWYSPALFAKQWQSLVGLKEKDLRKGMATAFIASFLCYLVISYTLAYLFGLLGVESMVEGLTIAGVVVFGIATPLTLTNAVYQQSRKKLWAIDTGYA